MKVGIMQPYFLPYLGYFQLIKAVDIFVIYDNVQFSKGWVNRNRFLKNGNPDYFTLPLKKDSDYKNFDERYLADSWKIKDKAAFLRQIKEAYQKAPFFSSTFSLLDQILQLDNENLFQINFKATELICHALGIQTKLLVSSEINIDHRLKGQTKVIEISKALQATEYLNPPGGIELYSEKDFAEANLSLRFLQPELKPYEQFKYSFVPGLSILDVLMFNDTNAVHAQLNNFSFKMPNH
jgi:hypothetical protein